MIKFGLDFETMTIQAHNESRFERTRVIKQGRRIRCFPTYKKQNKASQDGESHECIVSDGFNVVHHQA